MGKKVKEDKTAVIFGATGGVMEAALRTVYEVVTGEELEALDFHEVRGLEGVLTHIQHHFAHVIFSTMHIHLSERDCLEAIAVKGNVAEIRKLSDELSAERGVKILKTMLVPSL